MRPFKSTITVEEAHRRLEASVRPIARTERISVADAAGRVAAGDIRSTMAVPPFARSAMDGFAVIAGDTAGASEGAPVSLEVVGRIYTGQAATRSIQSGECIEIATGAPMPEGADAVVMVEQTVRQNDARVSIKAAAGAGQNVGKRGADIAEGDIVVQAGDWMTPSRVGAVAAIGCASLDAYARPRVAILSTGDEVVEPGSGLGPGQIFDVNRYTLGAVVAMHGGEIALYPPVPDRLDEQLAALDRSAGADIVVMSGGSSVGDRDLILDVVQARGEMVFHGIAIRPGKPTAFAIVNGAPFFGMPGNPTSCLSNAYIFLVPFLRRMARLPLFSPRKEQVPLGRRIVSPAGRHQFYTVKMENGVAWPAFKGSGEITSLSRADGYIEIPADQSSVEEGTIVEVKLFSNG